MCVCVHVSCATPVSILDVGKSNARRHEEKNCLQKKPHEKGKHPRSTPAKRHKACPTNTTRKRWSAEWREELFRDCRRFQGRHLNRELINDLLLQIGILESCTDLQRVRKLKPNVLLFAKQKYWAELPCKGQGAFAALQHLEASRYVVADVLPIEKSDFDPPNPVSACDLTQCTTCKDLRNALVLWLCLSHALADTELGNTLRRELEEALLPFKLHTWAHELMEPLLEQNNLTVLECLWNNFSLLKISILARIGSNVDQNEQAKRIPARAAEKFWQKLLGRTPCPEQESEAAVWAERCYSDQPAAREAPRDADLAATFLALLWILRHSADQSLSAAGLLQGLRLRRANHAAYATTARTSDDEDAGEDDIGGGDAGGGEDDIGGDDDEDDDWDTNNEGVEGDLLTALLGHWRDDQPAQHNLPLPTSANTAEEEEQIQLYSPVVANDEDEHGPDLTKTSSGPDDRSPQQTGRLDVLVDAAESLPPDTPPGGQSAREFGNEQHWVTYQGERVGGLPTSKHTDPLPSRT
eukprot:g18310.t1